MRHMAHKEMNCLCLSVQSRPQECPNAVTPAEKRSMLGLGAYKFTDASGSILRLGSMCNT